MPKLIVIPAAQTDWRAQGRLTGDTDLPLNEIGHRQALANSQAVADSGLTVIHSGPEQATKQTASIIAHELEIKVKTLKELREMDLGTWEGLTMEDFRERYSKIYRQWRQEPMSIEPPEGEAVSDVAERLTSGIRKAMKRNEQGTVALALGQFAGSIVRCEFDDGSYERFWDYVHSEQEHHVFEVTDIASLTAAATAKAPQPPEVGD
jgi:broad specificity phosphatase PhoE